MTNTVQTTSNSNEAFNKDRPILIMIRGLPGSGKSYLAEALQKSIGEDEVVIVDPDTIDTTSEAYVALSKSLTTEGVDAKFHPYRLLRAKAYDAIVAHKIIIWNQAFTNLDGFQKTIVNLQAYAADHGTQLPLLVVEMTVIEATAKKRVADRHANGGHGVNDETFTRFINEYASFSDQGYNTVIANGEDDVAVSVQTVTEALRAL